MEVTKSIREFKYNGVVLKDVPGATLEQVREFYATLYPEIVNAAIEGPTSTGAKTVYEFRRAVGTKGVIGAAMKAADASARLDRLLSRRAARAQALAVPPHDQRLHAAVARIASAVYRDEAMPDAVTAPAHALPLLP